MKSRKRSPKIYRTNISGQPQLIKAYSQAQAAARFGVAPSTFARWSNRTNLPLTTKIDIDLTT